MRRLGDRACRSTCERFGTKRSHASPFGHEHWGSELVLWSRTTTDVASVSIGRREASWVVTMYDNGITTERRFTTENAARMWAFAQKTRLADAGKLASGKIE
jgi:hypothetical protein